MACMLQTTVPTTRGERRMQQLLATLPDDWLVLCELRVADGFWRGAAMLQEKRPDFVVLAPEIGLMSIEVKDWDIWRNQYICLNQHYVRRDPDGATVENPWHQAWIYEQDLKHIVGGTIWVTSVVAFPRLQRATFLNRVRNLDRLHDPQAQKLIALERTLFEDDADEAQGGLRQALYRLVRVNPRFRPSTREAVDSALACLIPPELVVGDASERLARERQQLRTLSERQQRIAFQLPVGSHLYLDLAGSGKTNVLVSRALYLARSQQRPDGTLNILILTYSSKLARAIRLMLADKLRGDSTPAGSNIDVFTVEEVLVHLVASGYGADKEELVRQLSGRTPEERRRQLLEMSREVWPELGEGCRQYDAILVDEIQDFGPELGAVVEVLHRGEELFLVGDLAQRIFEPRLHVHRLGLEEDRRVPANYLMYRCPRPIAAVAHSFVVEDPIVAAEMENHGYRATPRFAGVGQSFPEFKQAVTPVEEEQLLLQTIDEHVADGIALRNILVVTSEQRVGRTLALLREHDVPARANPDSNDGVLVVSYADSKGLEGELVILTGVEDLPTRVHQMGAMAGSSSMAEIESRSRRLAYVGMTRTTARLVCIYRDRSHRLVAELLHQAGRALRGL
jgi:hypothetical protein